ncbi:hypothetical protein VTN00DRAFT_5696 [Thermoascus crustaceus]|uniref:uncharacterized protein n=1 Tax=Thermoascus crustaceus TaxID=5088 RepID=UPI0037435EB2
MSGRSSHLGGELARWTVLEGVEKQRTKETKKKEEERRKSRRDCWREQVVLEGEGEAEVRRRKRLRARRGRGETAVPPAAESASSPLSPPISARRGHAQSLLPLNSLLPSGATGGHSPNSPSFTPSRASPPQTGRKSTEHFH